MWSARESEIQGFKESDVQHMMLNFRPLTFSRPRDNGRSNFAACMTLMLLFTLTLAGCAKKLTEPRAVRGFIVTSVVASQKTATENMEVHAGLERQRELYLPNIDVYLNGTDS